MWHLAFLPLSQVDVNKKATETKIDNCPYWKVSFRQNKRDVVQREKDVFCCHETATPSTCGSMSTRRPGKLVSVHCLCPCLYCSCPCLYCMLVQLHYHTLRMCSPPLPSWPVLPGWIHLFLPRLEKVMILQFTCCVQNWNDTNSICNEKRILFHVVV